jgi:hypothetical protein
MSKMLTLEVWVKVDEAGNHEASVDAETCEERFRDNVGETPGEATRLVKLVITMPAPTVPTLTGTVPAEGDATLSVA